MSELRVLGLFLLPSLAAACTGEATLPPDVSVRMLWLNGDAEATLPPEVQSIFLRIDDPAGRPIDSNTLDITVEGGRRNVVQEDLPTDTPIEVIVRALDGGGVTRYVGAVGPIVLRPGERRYVDIFLYEVGTSTRALTEQTIGFLHTATNLKDGRILIAGGFGLPTPTLCPGTTSATTCFSVTATDQALLFEIATGRVYPVQGNMLSPRAGHTATLLPDGRVLIAGGASEAILGFELDGDGGRIPVFIPMDNGQPGALDDFEIFDPNLNQERDDLESNGDPGRGGFTGASSTTPGGTRALGIMNRQRFLHAASEIPESNGQRVLLLGGLGANGGSRSWEVYDDRKPGGQGFYDATSNRLPFDFETPSAVTLIAPEPGSVWAFGGRVAESNEELALVWRPGSTGDANGIVESASTFTAFPNTGAAADLPHPEYAFIRPAVAPIGDRAYALVVGWFGPRCDAGGAPIYPSSPGEPLCEAPADGAPEGGKSFTVNAGASGAPGTTQPTPTFNATPPAFAASVVLDDGSVVVAGGIASKDWTTLHTAPEWFERRVDAAGAAAIRADAIPALLEGRVFHQMTALPDVGYLVSGGLAFDGSNVTLVDRVEVVYPIADRPGTM